MSYNTDLQNNNEMLQSLLGIAQALPTNGINYSTEETPTGGTWIDGKPIYRKIFTGVVSTSTTTLGVINNLEQVISINGGVLASSGMYIPLNTNFGDTYKAHVFINLVGNNDVTCVSTSNYSGNIIVNVEYTKEDGDNGFLEPL